MGHIRIPDVLRCLDENRTEVSLICLELVWVWMLGILAQSPVALISPHATSVLGVQNSTESGP